MNDISALIESLSLREMEVFKHLGEGKRTKKIAHAMCVSTKTVETYIHNIKSKLDISDTLAVRMEAMRIAIKS